jgi:glycosyltransferase involved in cell wall biosynthesis/SAM-dependent methyltransferase
LNICTIIAKNYVAFARVLAESFREHHPDGNCSVLVIDDPTGFIDPAEEPFELLRIDQIGLPDAERMAAWYDVMELSTAVKPWLLRTLLERPGYDHVAYMDPDIRVFAPLEEVERRVRQHDVVLTPHFNKPLPRDGRKPAEEDILIAGSYNLGFIALRAGQTADELLDWWSERLENHCLNEPEVGRFVDQRWIDLVPGIWSDVDVLRDPTYNIAYWNLPTRGLEEDGAGYRVDGSPLRFFHFSGFDPRRPKDLSKHQNRVKVADDPALGRICREYADELLGHGYEEAIGWPYGWAALPNGVKLDRQARLAYREMVERGMSGESIFGEQGAARFAEYLEETGHGEGGPKLAPRPRPGINLVGYLSDERGVGEAARQLLAALRGGEVQVSEVDAPAEAEKIAAVLGRLGFDDYPYDFNLICVNADMLPLVARGLGPRFFQGRHTAGLWFWEVSHFPEEQRHAFDNVDEVWVATQHVADALSPLTSKPVKTIRVPIVPGEPAAATRAELGMPEGFCFLFVFDYRSVFKRKNPLGLVDAFRRAFEPGEGPSLVIKTIGDERFPKERGALAEAVANRSDIRLIEDMVSKEMKDAMIASCDCYVSLHRSEGLGLTMGEAMYFGKPVIATAYSGNLDFMTAENSYLVPHTMTEIGPDAPPYPADKEWAEPDLDLAAELMRQVFEDPEAAAQRGRRAADDIRRTHSPRASAEAIETLVTQIRRADLRERLEGPSPAQAAAGGLSGRAQLARLINVPTPPPRPGRGTRARTAAKRAYMRLLRPYTAHQQRINISIAESLDELREVLGETVSIAVEHDRTLQELVPEAEKLIDAAAAEPYMADDRLGPKLHPVLGETIGFRAAAGEGERDGYRGFEDVFRGSEEMIRDRQRVYLDLIAGHEPVLDAGCGRGEFLDLLEQNGVACRGVDLDPDMVRRCREKGHENVEQGDLLEALERAEPGSLGAIFSAQVIEHLEFGQLRRLLELGVSRLRPGGLLIAETVNPHSPAALKAFWVDPTHQHPLFPETMLSLCALAGYASGDVFAPVGTSAWDEDRTRVGEYAILATAPGQAS